MEQKIPTWLRGHVANWRGERQATVDLCASDGNEMLEVWYYGDLYQTPHRTQPYIMRTEDAPVKIVAKSPKSGEEFLVFDGGAHGYDNLFCYTHDDEALLNRPLQKLDIPPSRLVVELGYSIDYDVEKELYNFDENSNVILINGSTMPWEQLLTDGLDYLGLFYLDKNDEAVLIADEELA